MNVIAVEFATPEYDETVRLRYKILREPLGMDFTAEQLSEEYTDFHLAAFDVAWILRGCLVLTPLTEKVIKMRQVAVDSTYQSTGVGRALVEMSEVFSIAKGFEKMELNARETAVPFYLKLGYQTVGERFEEVAIPHFKMIKNLVQ